MITVLNHFFRFSKAIKVQKEFCLRYFEKVRTETGVDFQSSLTKQVGQKIRNYTLQVPLAIGETSAILRAYDLDEEERELLTLLSMGSALMDEVSDQSNDSSSLELLLNHLHNKAKAVRTINKSFDQLFDTTFKHHNYSAIQKSKLALSNEQLHQITFDKCGYAFLLSQSLLKHSISEPEKAFMYQFGGVAQLGDDILDLYDDLNEGYQTLITNQSIGKSKELLNKELNLLIEKIEVLPYPKTNLERVKLHCLTLIGVFYLAIERLESLLQNSTPSIEILNKKRDLFILDMNNISNQRKLFKWVNKH